MTFNPQSFELFLFTAKTALAKTAMDAGVDAIVIDWENKDKEKRQAGFPTQINYDSAEDLMNMRNSIQGRIVCRINRFNPAYSKQEIDEAIRHGADEILLPMVETQEEIEQVLEQIRGRTSLGILIETDNAVRNATQFTTLPLSRIYIGLNDLMISRNSRDLFLPLFDDTVLELKSIFKGIPVGVGGLTHPKCGHPTPSSILMKQYAALNINFSFLRRSFLNDMEQYGMCETIHAIREALKDIPQYSGKEPVHNR